MSDRQTQQAETNLGIHLAGFRKDLTVGTTRCTLSRHEQGSTASPTLRGVQKAVCGENAPCAILLPVVSLPELEQTVSEAGKAQ